MTPNDAMPRLDRLFSHVWMVRTFIKHSEEAEDDEDLSEVHRALYDGMLALGAPLRADDADGYIKMARKKLPKLKRATELFALVQPDISTHTNFEMAALSLTSAMTEIESLLDQVQ